MTEWTEQTETHHHHSEGPCRNTKKAPYSAFEWNQVKRKDLYCMMHKHISQTLITHGLFHSRGVERETFSTRDVLDLSITPFVDLVAALNQHIQVEIDGKKKSNIWDSFNISQV